MWPSDVVWWCLLLLISDALAQASDFRIERRQVVFLWWIQDSNPGWMPADKPTELSRIKQKLDLDSPSLWSASIQPIRPHCWLAFAPGSGDIHWYMFVVVDFDALAQASDFRIERRQVVFLYWMQEKSRFSHTQSPADWMPSDKLTDLWRIKQKLELDSPSLSSASIQPTQTHCRLAFAPGSGDKAHMVT